MVLLKPPRNTLFIRLWSSFAFFYHNQLCCVLLWIGFGVIVVQGVREGSTIRFLCAQVTALYILPWKCCISINNGLFVIFFWLISIKLSSAVSFDGLCWLSVGWNGYKGMVQFVFTVTTLSILPWKCCISINIALLTVFYPLPHALVGWFGCQLGVKLCVLIVFMQLEIRILSFWPKLEVIKKRWKMKRANRRDIAS
jgi:hypothetical protein